MNPHLVTLALYNEKFHLSTAAAADCWRTKTFRKRFFPLWGKKKETTVTLEEVCYTVDVEITAGEALVAPDGYTSSSPPSVCE